MRSLLSFPALLWSLTACVPGLGSGSFGGSDATVQSPSPQGPSQQNPPSQNPAPPSHGVPTKTFKVSGRDIFDPCGNAVIFRGVNAGASFPTDAQATQVPEIVQSRSNAVRFTLRVRYNNADGRVLGTWIKALSEQGILPIPALWGATGKWQNFDETVQWWFRPDVMEVLKQNQDRIIINILNEAGDGTVPASEFRSKYAAIIKRFRDAGIEAPLMIDATGWGRSHAMILENGHWLIEQDPLKNLIFSWHIWNPFDWKDPYFDVMKKASETKIPLVIGEFGPFEEHSGKRIPYEELLQAAGQYQVGWLAWWWVNDLNGNGTDARNMTRLGKYAQLTDFGRDVIMTSPQSIQRTAKPIPYLANKFQCK